MKDLLWNHRCGLISLRIVLIVTQVPFPLVFQDFPISTYYLGEVNRLPAHPERSRSEEKELPTRKTPNQPLIHLVSQRTQQFETGQWKEDRVQLYRSELSRYVQNYFHLLKLKILFRLSGKRNVPNVAVRKQEYEQRSSQERSLRPAESSPVSPIPYPLLSTGMSGNQTVIVGSKHLHVAPPLDYRDPSTFFVCLQFFFIDF